MPPAAATTYGSSRSARWCSRPAGDVVDFSFNEANHDAVSNTSPTAALSDRLDSVGWTVWLRRMIVLPIGERWAMIAVLTAVTTPRIVFYALLVGCALAASYTTAGRLLRSLTRKAQRTDRAAVALADLADSGPLAQAVVGAVRRPGGGFTAPLLALVGAVVIVATALFATYGSWLTVGAAAVYAVVSGLAVSRPLKGALDWLVPPVFRAAEYCTILVLAARSDVPHAVPRHSASFRPSPTITTTRCTASEAVPAHRPGGWCAPSAGTRAGPWSWPYSPPY